MTAEVSRLRVQVHIVFGRRSVRTADVQIKARQGATSHRHHQLAQRSPSGHCRELLPRRPSAASRPSSRIARRACVGIAAFDRLIPRGRWQSASRAATVSGSSCAPLARQNSFVPGGSPCPVGLAAGAGPQSRPTLPLPFRGAIGASVLRPIPGASPRLGDATHSPDSRDVDWRGRSPALGAHRAIGRPRRSKSMARHRPQPRPHAPGPVRHAALPSADAGPVPALRLANRAPLFPAVGRAARRALVRADKIPPASLRAIPREVFAFFAFPSRDRESALESHPASAPPRHWPDVRDVFLAAAF